HPGTILPGVIGLILVVISLIMAGVDMYPGTPMLPSLPQLTLPLENLGIAVGSSIVIGLILARFLPHTPIYRTLVSQSASGVGTEKEFQEQQAAHVGQIGVAISNLRPGGKARFGEQVLDVITQGEMIAKGQPVRVLRYSGAEAVVELAS
ncbi:MAG TPA: NfeD family protein, partial [Verrucomicrobiae bacterium]|nr:NfeD family protein [Verrucomicrobiae bacterium]